MTPATMVSQERPSRLSSLLPGSRTGRYPGPAMPARANAVKLTG